MKKIRIQKRSFLTSSIYNIQNLQSFYKHAMLHLCMFPTFFHGKNAACSPRFCLLLRVRDQRKNVTNAPMSFGINGTRQDPARIPDSGKTSVWKTFVIYPSALRPFCRPRAGYKSSARPSTIARWQWQQTLVQNDTGTPPPPPWTWR